MSVQEIRELLDCGVPPCEIEELAEAHDLATLDTCIYCQLPIQECDCLDG